MKRRLARELPTSDSSLSPGADRADGVVSALISWDLVSVALDSDRMVLVFSRNGDWSYTRVVPSFGETSNCRVPRESAWISSVNAMKGVSDDARLRRANFFGRWDGSAGDPGRQIPAWCACVAVAPRAAAGKANRGWNGGLPADNDRPSAMGVTGGGGGGAGCKGTAMGRSAGGSIRRSSWDFLDCARCCIWSEQNPL